MNKTFYFQISNGDDEWESKEYPTKEEAQEAQNELKEQGFIISEIKEIRE